MIIDKSNKQRLIGIACIIATSAISGLAAAQSTSASSEMKPKTSATASRHETNAVKHVNDAATVVTRIESRPGMNTLLQQAKGVFIVPSYKRAALGVGGSGGSAVLLAKREDGTWSDPAFYNIGGINVGVQAGVEVGPIVLVLNNDKAVEKFMEKNNFSLSADSGITIVNWTKMAQGSIGTGDVVVWSGTEGLFANVAAIGVNDIRFNQNETTAYYQQKVAAKDVITGKVSNPQADTLKQALAASSTSTSTGSSGESTSGGSGMSEEKK